MVVRWEPGSPPRWARLCDFGCVTCLPLGPQFLVCKVLGVCIGGVGCKDWRISKIPSATKSLQSIVH